jgi:Alginate lyase
VTERTERDIQARHGYRRLSLARKGPAIEHLSPSLVALCLCPLLGACPVGGAVENSTSSIDYSIWLLQLPIGSGSSPTTVSSSELTAGYTSAYFYKASDGGQAFMDPATGVTTSGSEHCRTELRESTTGGAQAAWAGSGTHSMTVSGQVLKVGGGSSGTVTVGQLFNGTDAIPLCELEFSTRAGGFKLLYEEAKGAGTSTDLGTPIALHTPYTFALALTGGELRVTVNGKQVYTRTPSASTLAKKFYFKFGNYDQTAVAGAIGATPYTVVEVYSVRVVHE